MRFYQLLGKLTKHYLFWMLFFAVARTVFLGYNSQEILSFGFVEVIKSFYYGYKLDQSIVSYALMLPLLLMTAGALLKSTVPDKIIKYYTVFFIAVLSVLITAELNIYHEWGQKLSFKAISYLSRPSEVFHTASWQMLVFGFGFAIGLTWVFVWLYNRFVHSQIQVKRPNYLDTILFLGSMAGVLGAGARGGFQPIPISQSESFYSEHAFLNTAAINSVWNLMHSIEKNAKYGVDNPFEFYDKNEAEQIIANLRTVPKDTTISIFNAECPNVVLLILESWAGSMIESLGGMKGVAPNFEKLIEEGLLFDNFYATATLSHQGMVALFSGFPTTPHVDIINQIEKVSQLPKLNKHLEKQGYHTSFLFGGQLIYGNIKGYFMDAGFNQITEGEDFEKEYAQGRLGVHDEGLYRKLILQQKEYKQPFFSAAFTASTHSPFDHPPMAKVIDTGGEHQQFVNSVHYADSCLFAYMQEAKKQDWYKNTVFLIVADHSHPTPVKFNSTYSPGYRKVPFLIWGEPLRATFKGTKNSRLMSQYDIPATLLAQLKLPHTEFEWSNNIYNPYTPEYAHYGFDDGLGWLTPEGYFVYQSWEKDRSNKGYIEQAFDTEEKADSIRKIGQSYLQVLYQRYLDY